MRSIIRDKSHSRTPVHSIVAEIAKAMTSPGHSGRRGICSATGLVSSAWLRSRTVMSIAISTSPNETTDRYEPNLALPFRNGMPNIIRIAETVLSHKICRNEIVI
jgi:hypothetical protein